MTKLLVILGLFGFVFSAQAAEPTLYHFTPNPDSVAQCARAGFTGPFTFTHKVAGAWEVRFPTTGAKFVVFKKTKTHYIMSVMGGISIHSSVDFSDGTLRHAETRETFSRRCAGRFRQ